MRSFIPNFLTVLNLVFGIFAIVASFHGQFVQAAVWIVLAGVADNLDGRAARYFKVTCEFGKELDSLCDLVSFGVAPAIMAYIFLLNDFGWAGTIIAAFFAACGALRLARFNVNTDVVKGYFLGLPIPAAGCCVAAFVAVGMKPEGYLFPAMVIVIAYLMVSKIKYPDFKGKGEKVHLIPVVISLLLAGYIVFLSLTAVLFAIISGYVVFGILNTIFAVFASRSIK